MQRSNFASLAVRWRVGLRLRERAVGYGRCIEGGDDDLRGHAVALVPLAQLLCQLLTVRSLVSLARCFLTEHVMGEKF